MFGRATIRLDIGPHSSLFLITYYNRLLVLPTDLHNIDASNSWRKVECEVDPEK